MFPSRSGHPRHSWRGGLRRQVILSGGNRCWQNLITKWPPSYHSPLPGCHNPDSIPFPAFHTGFSYLKVMDNFVGFVYVCSGLKIVLFPINWQHIMMHGLTPISHWIWWEYRIRKTQFSSDSAINLLYYCSNERDTFQALNRCDLRNRQTRRTSGWPWPLLRPQRRRPNNQSLRRERSLV